MWLLMSVILTGFAHTAFADDLSGYVFTSDNDFYSKNYDEPAIQVVKSSYNAVSDVNVYEFKLRCGTTAFGAGENDANSYKRPCNSWWTGDVKLTIDGEEVATLSAIQWISLVSYWTSNGSGWRESATVGIGDGDGVKAFAATIKQKKYSLMNAWSGTYSDGGARMWSSQNYDERQGVYTYKEIGSLSGNASNKSSVFVSILDAQYHDDGKVQARNSWWLYHHYTCYVTIRVAIERKWDHWNPKIGVKGNWNYTYKNDKGNDSYNNTQSYHLTFNTSNLSGIKWPSTVGTIQRSGNGKFTYTVPSGLTKMTGYQRGEGYNDKVSCSFVNNVTLLKSQPDKNAPWTVYGNAGYHYLKLTDVSSSTSMQEITGVDNYNPVYIYPCWEFQSAENYKSMVTQTATYNQHHDKLYDVVILNGYPRPKSVSVTAYNTYSREAKISWVSEVADSEHANTKGNWIVFRQETGKPSTFTKVGETTNYSNAELVDETHAIEYGKSYDYIVVFNPNEWPERTVNGPDDATGLSKSVSYTMNRDFAFNNVSAEAGESNITVKWGHSNILDASSSNKYIYHVQRSTDQVNWEDISGSKEVTSKDVNGGSFVDNNVKAKTTYYYRIYFESVQGQAKTSGITNATTGGSKIESMTTSRGNYADVVKITWTVKQVGDGLSFFTLQRRPLGSEGESGWVDIYTTSGTASSYSYDDQTAQPGSFNEYRLKHAEMENGKLTDNTSKTCDGFCMARGVVSGRVSFNSGTAVEGVKVTMRPNSSNGSELNAFYSLPFNGAAGQGIKADLTSDEIKKLFSKNFTAQMWVKPDSTLMKQNNDYILFDVLNTFTIRLVRHYDKGNANGYWLRIYADKTDNQVDSTYIKSNVWNHITCSYSNGKFDIYVIRDDSDFKHFTLEKTVSIADEAKCVSLANSASMNYIRAFAGNLDEVRLYNRALTEKEIKSTWNHTLAGSEEGLQIYWPFDEGLKTQTIVYDFSKQNGISNGHHGFIASSVVPTTEVPSEDQLSLMAYTDADGNYMIGGVPLSGDGTNYVLTPTLGSHQFSPTNQSRFFSTKSLVQTGVDYEDVSSFPVSGVVYYENTNIPVKDVYVKVDGVTASRDGKAVVTDEEGKFTVDVPIGDHFVSLSLNGHTFVNEGRYPDNPYERHNFDGEVKGLTFYDNTMVMVAGRVAGGDIEHDKPLGVGAGKANIGKAVITLEHENSNQFINVERTVDGTEVKYDASASDRVFETTDGCTVKVAGGKNVITVETNATTGEWAAKLPPLRYKVKSVNLVNNKDDIQFKNLPTIDATNPSLVYTDSIVVDKNVRKFEYVGSAKIEHKAASTLDVTENADGTFGDATYTVKDASNKEHEIELYNVDENGKVNYTFGYPVYQELGTYTYTIYGYERYANYDGEKPVIDEVPLAGKKVTIQNQYASTSKIICTAPDNSGHKVGEVYEMEKNAFELDSLGYGTYQFTVGYPNIVEPYTRGLTITYNNSGVEQEWSGNGKFKVIVLGGLPTGKNFVTQGPDEITMVLRDPPGTGSSTTWSKGTSVSITKGRTVEPHASESINASIYAGVETATGEGLGFMVIQDLEALATINAGAEISTSFANMKSTTMTTTTTRDISTSDGFDFNGPAGDLFIGSAKNLIFGACHAVDICWNDVTGKPELQMNDALATGEEFTTGFAYSQNYVKNVLIPNFEDLRNSLLKRVAKIDVESMRPAKGEEPVYLTTLSEDDPKYGSSNNSKDIWGNKAVSFSTLKNGVYAGPSYTIILPAGFNEDFQDMVNFYNIQINKWEHQLYLNEQAKVTAIQNSSEWLRENHSFDAGAAINISMSNESTKSRVNTETQEINATLGLETGYRFSGLGLGLQMSATYGMTLTEEQQRDETETETFSYSLVEDGDDDYLSVDVFEAPDGFGPIFYTRAGATSAPYQDEEVTEYYEPGTVIMEKTVQIEKPEIEAAVQSITGIPAGGKGTFQVYIRNLSDTKEDGWFDINVVSQSNPDGLVVKMDGLNITSGRPVLVRAGETMVKTFTVEQSNPDVLNYEDIKIRIASQSQKDNTGVYPEIADTTSISVYFQPTCSDIQFASSHKLVNTDTETPVTLSMSGYNYSMSSLKGIRLQYKGSSDADFTTLQEYSKDAERVAKDKNLKLLPALEGTSKLTYTIDLRSSQFTDQTYTFRAITVCDLGGNEVNNESEEIDIVRDMTRPQLIAQPTPSSGILGVGDNLTVTFNEDIQAGALSSLTNFDVVGVLNETEVTHDVALSLTGENVAKTESTMDLSGKSFSASMWVNYSTDGTLFQHGTNDNKFTVKVSGGKLVVAVNDSKATSKATLPKNKWMYLNVGYDADNNAVSAGYALDASTVTLINSEIVDPYEGNGAVSVGGGNMTAKVQELAVWNGCRSMAEAQADMYTTKNQYTNGLIGYWQMNEGHGNVATDKARSRNMVLASDNAWWIAGDNYALKLDGAKAVAANIAAINTTGSEDYMVEAWFRADASQNGVASVMSTQAMDVRLNKDGHMEIELNGSTSDVVKTNLRDGQWHHLAVNVLKSSNGAGVIYVDGVQRKQFSASAMPVLYGDKLMLGSRCTSGVYSEFLKGAVDEVRIWKGRRTADVIKDNMYNRVKADEAGLVAYYPMERLGLDEYNQVVTASNLKDAVKDKEALSCYTKAGVDATATAVKDNTPALKVAPSKTNVEFSFVASERQITVNLTERPYKLEGCNIYITAKNVKDVHGNAALPITWGVYVQQNNLCWKNKEAQVVKAGNKEQTFTATIENKGAESEAWSLNGMPEWITADVESGTLTPLSSQTITFSVAPSLPIGSYETAVYLTGSKNIDAPLYVSVSSEGEAPDWTVVPGENTMTIVGQLKIDGVLSNDPKDMIAAFRGTECVGVASPKYFSRYDAYMVMLNIYGSESGDLTYKTYDASVGTVYPAVSVSNESAYTFAADKAIGTFGEPVAFSPLNEIEQSISSNGKGWKWFSLYAQPKTNTPSEVFKNAKSAIRAIIGGSSSLVNWKGGLDSFSFDEMYKLQATDGYLESIVGEPTEPSNVTISVKNGWNWIGYPVQATNSLNAAFAGAEPQEGDMVKNQSSFSIFTEGEWVGTLNAMVPGDGYMYSSNASATKSFTFPRPAVSGRRDVARRVSASCVTPLAFESNMTMVAVVMNGDDVVENATVSVYAGTELRGQSSQAVLDDMHFVTIGGSNGVADVLTYVVTTEDGQSYVLRNSDMFVADAQMGTVQQPYVLQIGKATDIDLARGDLEVEKVVLYDGSGRMVGNGSKPYTQSDINAFGAGVFFQQIYYVNGQTNMQKMIGELR